MELKQNQTQNSSDKTFLTILSDGKLHQRVEEGTPGAVEREYKRDVKDDKGKVIGEEKCVVHELLYESLTGNITNGYFNKGLFGENLILEIDNDGAVSIPVKSRFAETFMNMLPNIELNKPVVLKTYSYIPKGKTEKSKGISVTQDGVKIQGYFKQYIDGKYEFDSEYPVYNEDEHGDYKEFMNGPVSRFLVKKTKAIFEANNFKAPEPKEDSATSTKATDVAEEEDDITKKF